LQSNHCNPISEFRCTDPQIQPLPDPASPCQPPPAPGSPCQPSPAPARPCQLPLAPASSCQSLSGPPRPLPALASFCHPCSCPPLPGPASPCPALPAPNLRYIRNLPTQINSPIHICADGSAAEASALKFIQRRGLHDTSLEITSITEVRGERRILSTSFINNNTDDSCIPRCIRRHCGIAYTALRLTQIAC
jgi:hypothetical protein